MLAVAPARRRNQLQANALADSSMLILHIIGGLGPGGAEALLYKLATQESDADHQIVCLGPREWYSGPLEEAGIPLYHLDIERLLEIPGGLRRLRRLILEINPDIVQTWMYNANLLAGSIAAAAGFPVVWGIHHSTLDVLSFRSRLVVRAGGLLARWIPEFIINCSRRSADVHAGLGYSAAAGTVIPNGYDPDLFSIDDPRRVETRERLAIAADVFLVGGIGRWHRQKDVPNLLRAIAMVSGRGVPIRAILAGGGLGDDNAELQAALAEAGCESLILPLGRRADIPDLARAMDLHVLASSGGEAFPNVVAETMLSGTPNVVTDVGDAALIVGDTGWVVPARNPEMLADAIEESWRERSSRPLSWKRRRLRARDRIVRNFTLDKMAAAYRDVWHRVAGFRGGATPRGVRARPRVRR
jgi:glycosyltransferase involved in cell wall biosynthesis